MEDFILVGQYILVGQSSDDIKTADHTSRLLLYWEQMSNGVKYSSFPSANEL